MFVKLLILNAFVAGAFCVPKNFKRGDANEWSTNEQIQPDLPSTEVNVPPPKSNQGAQPIQSYGPPPINNQGSQPIPSYGPPPQNNQAIHPVPSNVPQNNQGVQPIQSNGPPSVNNQAGQAVQSYRPAPQNNHAVPSNTPQSNQGGQTVQSYRPSPQISQPVPSNAPQNNQGVQTPTRINNNNGQGNLSKFSYGFLQTVRKEWKCANGQCTEQVTKCKNGQCDSVENRFKADNYEPEVPELAPIPFPTFNFAEFFNFPGLSKQELESFFNFDNFGLMDAVIDPKNSDYYFTQAKFITSKCKDHECLVNTKNCKNGKCNEASERRSF